MKSNVTHLFRNVLLMLWIPIITMGQHAESTDSVGKKFTFTGFLDVYYGYDINRVDRDIRLPFLYNHNRHNQVNVNLAMVKMNYELGRLSVNMGLHAGTYVQDNYTQEPTALSYIHEANIAWRFNDKVSVQAGIMPSYLGWESAITSDNLTVSRSLAAENSPYFMTGAHVLYTPKPQWLIGIGLYNGWQRIQKVVGSNIPSIGSQITYMQDKWSLHNNTFIGTEDNDYFRRMRYFNNFYFKGTISKWELLLGLDMGLQQTAKGVNSYHHWFTPVIISSYQIDDRWKAAYRMEYYSDQYSIIVPTTLGNVFKMFGFSFNMDYKLHDNLVWRNEVRYLKNESNIFPHHSGIYKDNNLFLLSSLNFYIKK